MSATVEAAYRDRHCQKQLSGPGVPGSRGYQSPTHRPTKQGLALAVGLSLVGLVALTLAR